MFVALEARSRCLLCGFRDRVIMMGTARINKRSMRVQGPLIGSLGYRSCPECGITEQGEMQPRSEYVLTAKDAVKVAEYRERRWPELVTEAARRGVA
jgi:hypothetical protein